MKRGIRNVDTLGGLQPATIISEPGLYKMIQASRKPGAKAFDRWVRHEVLPSIRKAGAYRAAPRVTEELPALPPPPPSVPALRPSHVQPVLCEDAARYRSLMSR